MVALHLDFNGHTTSQAMAIPLRMNMLFQAAGENAVKHVLEVRRIFLWE